MGNEVGKWPLILGAALLAGLVTALGMAGWLRNASDIMLSLGQASLSWCL